MRLPELLLFKLIIVTVLSIVAHPPMSGQICPDPASAREIFHGNDIRTVMTNSGSLFQGYLGLFQVPFTGPQSINAITTDDPVPRGFRIYPNPSRGRITIENTGLPIGTPFTVLNSLGQMITDGQLDGDLTLVDLPVGLFYVVVHELTSRVEKVVIID